MGMNSKLLCRLFCASLGTLLGSPGKAAPRTGYLGLMGGTKKSGISAAVFFFSDGRIRGLRVFQNQVSGTFRAATSRCLRPWEAEV